MKYKDYEDFLKEVHADRCICTDDDMGECYEEWSGNLDYDVWCMYADRYADIKVKEAIQAREKQEYDDEQTELLEKQTQDKY